MPMDRAGFPLKIQGFAIGRGLGDVSATCRPSAPAGALAETLAAWR